MNCNLKIKKISITKRDRHNDVIKEPNCHDLLHRKETIEIFTRGKLSVICPSDRK